MDLRLQDLEEGDFYLPATAGGSLNKITNDQLELGWAVAEKPPPPTQPAYLKGTRRG